MTRIALAAAAACALATAAAAQTPKPELAYTKYGESRAYFRDQLAACRPGGYCSVVSYAGAGPDAAGVDADYLFRVGSAERGRGYELIFTGVESYVAPTSPIVVSIDGQRIAELAAGAERGWRSVDNIANEYQFSEGPANAEVLPAMKAGARMTLAFTDMEGGARDVSFSLMGLSNALAWIEGARLQ